MQDLAKPYFLTLTRNEQKSAIEALIFASDEVITADSLFKILVLNDLDSAEVEVDENGHFKVKKNGTAEIEKSVDALFGFSKADLTELIEEVNNDLLNSNRPYYIVNYAGGYQFATRPAFGALIQNLIKAKTKRRLSQASLETLAIVAYRQPVTKPEIEMIRGVNSNEVVNSLIEKNFVKISGRKDSIGKPLLYSVTDEFLRAFGLKSLEELPKLRELDELAESVSTRISEAEDFVLEIPLEEAEDSSAPDDIPMLTDMNIEMENFAKEDNDSAEKPSSNTDASLDIEADKVENSDEKPDDVEESEAITIVGQTSEESL